MLDLRVRRKLEKLNKQAERRPQNKIPWAAVLDAFEHCCLYCGTSFQTTTASRDHVTTKAAGGSNRIWNYVPSCIPCNRLRGSQMIVAFILALPHADRIVLRWRNGIAALRLRFRTHTRFNRFREELDQLLHHESLIELIERKLPR